MTSKTLLAVGAAGQFAGHAVGAFSERHARVKRSGAPRIVFSSVIHPVLTELANHAAKASVEAAILDSGLEYTILHPTLYFQNYAAAWPKVVASGVLPEPWSSETRFSRVDYRDVAEVAAIALFEDRLLPSSCAPTVRSIGTRSRR
jgi:uncharacterized protein YbjT (DUF2867 family)